MRTPGEETNPDVALHRTEADGCSAGLLRVAENHMGGFSGGTGPTDGDFAGGVALAVVDHLEKCWLGNNAGLGVAAEHVFDGDEGCVIDLVAEADKETAALTDQMHGR